ncbi:uncharacterized protein G2W53_016338 [Senna tora]|uniref:Uncharacterized protein n=1 Tax=Senna tora TaxID=362788 RepID=A0A834TP96_9FABA|nr:uncharacterized protein G2W53_016338 [Senna tora]
MLRLLRFSSVQNQYALRCGSYKKQQQGYRMMVSSCTLSTGTSKLA